MIIRIQKGHEPKICIVESPDHNRPRAFRDKEKALSFIGSQIDLHLDPPDPPPAEEYPEGTKPITHAEVYRQGNFFNTPDQTHDIEMHYTPDHLEQDKINPLYKAFWTCEEEDGDLKWTGTLISWLDEGEYTYLPLSTHHQNANMPRAFPDFRNGLGTIAAAIVKHYNKSLSDTVINEANRKKRQNEVTYAMQDIAAFSELQEFRGHLP